MDEIRAAVEGRGEALALQKDELEALTRSRAWGMLVAFIEDQTARRMNEVMTAPLATTAELAKHNYLRGECGGMNLVKKFVEETLQVSREAVEIFRQSVDKGEER